MAKITLKQHHIIVSTLWNNGICNAKTLHKLTSILCSTIYNYVKKLINGNTLNPLSYSSKSKKLSSKKWHFLSHLVLANKFATCAKLANILNENYTNLNVTNQTVLNKLNNLNYFNTISKSIPLLTD